jgi:hypothetical protein
MLDRCYKHQDLRLETYGYHTFALGVGQLLPPQISISTATKFQCIAILPSSHISYVMVLCNCYGVFLLLILPKSIHPECFPCRRTRPHGHVICGFGMPVSKQSYCVFLGSINSRYLLLRALALIVHETNCKINLPGSSSSLHPAETRQVPDDHLVIQILLNPTPSYLLFPGTSM